jgi:WD40 repeat protein|tara:strand:- start:1341 stop:2393 length:1053 start_codon:yes stop_codon:yes gene_type:complete
LSIGKEDSDSTDYLFSGIRSISTTENGNIILSSTSDKTIRIYSPEGNFIKKFGGRGRGPGDFLEVTSIDVDTEGNLIVLDRFQNRISFFDSNEGFTHSIVLKLEALGLTKVFDDPKSDEFIVVSRDFLNPDDKGNLLHRYNSNFENKVGEYLNVFNYFFDKSSPLEVQMSQLPNYKASQLTPNTIAATSGFYDGTIFVFNTETNKGQVFGEKIPELATEYDSNNWEKYLNSDEVGFQTASGPSGRFLFKPSGSNISIVGNSQFIVLFFYTFSDKKIIPSADIYSKDGEKLANIILTDSPLNFIHDKRVSIVPHFLDEENNLYVFDYNYKNSFPAARVFKTNLDELLESKE